MTTQLELMMGKNFEKFFGEPKMKSNETPQSSECDTGECEHDHSKTAEELLAESVEFDESDYDTRANPDGR